MWYLRQKAKDKEIREREKMFPDIQEQALDMFYGFATLSTVMMGLSFFLSRLTTETETGLRHLMHVSGLSRYAFWIAMAGLEGWAQGLAEALIVAAVAGLVLRIRVVANSSALLLILSLGLIVGSAVLFACMLHMVFRTRRTTNIVAPGLAIVVTISAPFYCAMNPVVSQKMLSWAVLICPIVPAFQTLWTLAKACSITNENRCLDLPALANGTWVPPVQMMLGSDDTDSVTLGSGYMSLVGLVLTQMVVFWVVVLAIDMYHHRGLERHRVIEDKGNSRASNDSRQVHNMLEVHNLVHWYGMVPGLQAPAHARVLNGVTFSVAPGAMLGLLGPNGAGKTTCIRCITGEEAAREGQVALCPRDAGVTIGSAASQCSHPQICNSATEIIESEEHDIESSECLLVAAEPPGTTCSDLGLCPQESALHADLTVEEHLLLFARLRGTAKIRQSVDHFLGAIRLEAKRDVVPAELSGGMRRRLAIGCAMVGHPVLALLDEPTTGLDPVARHEIWEAIMEARNAGTACLLTTHMLEEAEELCTHIVILSGGIVAAEGSVQQLKDSWSTGYLLRVDARPKEEAKAKEYIASLLPSEFRQPVKTSLHGQMIFNCSKDAEFVGNLFLKLAREAEGNGIRHWGISQASLEDAYLHIISQ